MAQPIAPQTVEYQVAFTTAAVATGSMTVNSSIAIDPPHTGAGRGPTRGTTGPVPPADSEIALVGTVQPESAQGESGTDPGHHRARIPANKGRRYPPEVLTPAEISALLEACATNPYTELRNRALLTTLYRTGLRCSEALALEPKDVDFIGTSIRVLHGKGDRARTVGIDPSALRLIDQWLAERARRGFTATQPLFCTAAGNRVPGSYVRSFVKRLGSQAGIAKRVHAHGLRHTHAFELMMEGVPIPIIQRQLGHSSLATTDIYLSHIAPKQVIDAIASREWRI